MIRVLLKVRSQLSGTIIIELDGTMKVVGGNENELLPFIVENAILTKAGYAIAKIWGIESNELGEKSIREMEKIENE